MATSENLVEAEIMTHELSLNIVKLYPKSKGFRNFNMIHLWEAYIEIKARNEMIGQKQVSQTVS